MRGLWGNIGSTKQNKHKNTGGKKGSATLGVKTMIVCKVRVAVRAWTALSMSLVGQGGGGGGGGHYLACGPTAH